EVRSLATVPRAVPGPCWLSAARPPGRKSRGRNCVNLLLVEDDERVRRFVVKGLESEGFTVTVAEDGPSGLAKALSGQHDVIVLDVMLPGMDGHEVCRRIRTARCGTPVLMLTA